MHRISVSALILGAMLLAGPAQAHDFWKLEPAATPVEGRLAIALNLSEFNMEPGGQTSLSLPDGTRRTATLRRVENHQLGGHTWVGSIDGGLDTDRLLVTEVGGFAFGELLVDGKRFLIEPAQGKKGHVLFAARSPERHEIEFGNDTLLPPKPAGVQAGSDKTAKPAKPTVTGTAGDIDVGIFYHDSMIDRWGLGLAARLQFLVSLYDAALLSGDTGVRANLVHVEERTGTIDGKNNSDTLSDFQSNLSNADGDFSGIEAVRTAKGIDQVSYIRRFKASTQVSCGVAYRLGDSSTHTYPGSGDAPFAYAVISDDIDIDRVPGESYSLCSTYTLAHEVGHNMGQVHNTEDASSPGVDTFSYGYRKDGEFRTIMSYGSSTGEDRLGYYSNKDLIKCKDPSSSNALEACGSATADVARSIRENGKNMQDFRTKGTRLLAAVLPVSRAIGDASGSGVATAFASVINPAGSGTATDCKIAWPGATGSQFSYQTTTAANALTGAPDTPVSIADGATQNFVFSITPGTEFDGAFVPLDFQCSNRASAEIADGLNSLLFSATDGTTADVVALSATVGSDGIVNTAPSGAFSVAVYNVGATDTISAHAVSSNSALGVTTSICETVPATGACKATPAASLSLSLAKDATATFGVFVTESSTIPFDPAQNRILVYFDVGAATKGATSVAIRTKP